MEKIRKSETEWRQLLGPEKFHILREKGTERPGTGALYHNQETGTYACGACGLELFASDAKYDSGSGWPSFFTPIDATRIDTSEDTTHGMRRVEVLCARCGSHLGHVFPDGPRPTGLRYCINSASLDFHKK